jgi:hypothetical protein
MVARDGIEPPTPAFSGPRSTTELSGLGMGRLLSGIAKNHRALLSTALQLHLSPRPFQGSLPLAGNQQRKRIPSIATPGYTANSSLLAVRCWWFVVCCWFAVYEVVRVCEGLHPSH